MDVKNFDTRPLALPIKKIIQENPSTNTYVFEYPLGSKPGQFVMLWIPGVDEKPFSIAYDDGQEFWLTICRVGPATEELFKLEVGDKVGIRGPFGTSYKIKEGDKLALVCGGYGAAPMYSVAYEAVNKGCEVDFLVGARNKDLLLFTDKILALGSGVTLHISTDDGSVGAKGFVTEILQKLLESKNIDKVFSCGPERMMEAAGKVVDASDKDVEYFLSVERYMKCGIGVCGQCSLDDNGEYVCLTGPVMPWTRVKKLSEFGKYHRDAQGKKHYL